MTPACPAVSPQPTSPRSPETQKAPVPAMSRNGHSRHEQQDVAEHVTPEAVAALTDWHDRHDPRR